MPTETDEKYNEKQDKSIAFITLFSMNETKVTNCVARHNNK